MDTRSGQGQREPVGRLIAAVVLAAACAGLVAAAMVGDVPDPIRGGPEPSDFARPAPRARSRARAPEPPRIVPVAPAADAVARSDGSESAGPGTSRPDGIETTLDPSGCRTETAWSGGRRHGLSETRYPDGRVRFRGAYDHGAETGTWESWYPDGTLRSSKTMVRGLPEGVMRTYHPNGRIETESWYAGGIDVGTSRGWYDDGTPEYEMPYVLGKRRGQALWYHRDGTLRARGTYVDDRLDGEYVEQDEAGHVVLREVWRDGVCVEGPSSRIRDTAPEERR